MSTLPYLYITRDQWRIQESVWRGGGHFFHDNKKLNLVEVQSVWSNASFWRKKVKQPGIKQSNLCYSIQINHHPGATVFQFIILTFIYSSTCFGRSTAHHQEANDCSNSLWFYLRIVVTVVLCSWSVRPRTQHEYHHDTKVKPEAATAVIELLMMGGKRPKHVEL